MRKAISSLSLLFAVFLFNQSSAAGESAELSSRVLNEIIELKQKYLQMEESMTKNINVLEEKVKSQDIKIHKLEQENARLKMATKKELFYSNEITKLQTRLNYREKRVKNIEKKLEENETHPESTIQMLGMNKDKKNEYSQTSDIVKHNTTKHEKNNIKGAYNNRDSDRTGASSRMIRLTGSRSAFYAYLTNDIPSPSPHKTLIYDHIVTNEGGNYDNQTGMFKVVDSGIYVFSATTISDVNTVVFYEIVKNGSPFAIGLANSAAIGTYHTGTLTGVINGDIGDVIYVRTQDPTGSAGQDLRSIKSQTWARTSFCGWRID